MGVSDRPRYPNFVAFISTGAILGVVLAGVLTWNAGEFERYSVAGALGYNAVVFGLLAAILGIFALVITVVMLMRAIQSLLDLAVSWERAVYLSYLILGTLFSLVAVVLFKKRNANAS